MQRNSEPLPLIRHLIKELVNDKYCLQEKDFRKNNSESI